MLCWPTKRSSTPTAELCLPRLLLRPPGRSGRWYHGAHRTPSTRRWRRRRSGSSRRPSSPRQSGTRLRRRRPSATPSSTCRRARQWRHADGARLPAAQRSLEHAPRQQRAVARGVVVQQQKVDDSRCPARPAPARRTTRRAPSSSAPRRRRRHRTGSSRRRRRRRAARPRAPPPAGCTARVGRASRRAVASSASPTTSRSRRFCPACRTPQRPTMSRAVSALRSHAYNTQLAERRPRLRLVAGLVRGLRQGATSVGAPFGWIGCLRDA